MSCILTPLTTLGLAPDDNFLGLFLILAVILGLILSNKPR